MDSISKNNYLDQAIQTVQEEIEKLRESRAQQVGLKGDKGSPERSRAILLLGIAGILGFSLLNSMILDILLPGSLLRVPHFLNKASRSIQDITTNPYTLLVAIVGIILISAPIVRLVWVRPQGSTQSFAWSTLSIGVGLTILVMPSYRFLPDEQTRFNILAGFFASAGLCSPIAYYILLGEDGGERMAVGRHVIVPSLLLIAFALIWIAYVSIHGKFLVFLILEAAFAYFSWFLIVKGVEQAHACRRIEQIDTDLKILNSRLSHLLRQHEIEQQWKSLLEP